MKSKSANQKLQQKKSLFFSIGLVVALSLVITAFEWKTFTIGPVVDLEKASDDGYEQPVIIPTYQPAPQRPKTILIDVVEPRVEEEKVIDAVKEIDPVIFTRDASASVGFDLPTLPIEKPDEAPYEIVEEMPSFEGGDKAFFKYVSENLKYPKKTRGIEGKVFISFVIDKDGSITDVEVMKGIGYYFDEAAKKVIQDSPKWNPGKQRGVAVKVKMVLPISFTLK